MKPVLQAILVADHVYTDAGTGKKIVSGIFHNLWYKKAMAQEVQQPGGETKLVLPINAGGYRAGSPFCYISLTDVHDEQHFKLRYVDLSEDNVLFEAGFTVNCKDPLQTTEIALPLPMLPAIKPGTFALELMWNNETLGSHRLQVGEVKDDGQPKPPGA